MNLLPPIKKDFVAFLEELPTKRVCPFWKFCSSDGQSAKHTVNKHIGGECRQQRPDFNAGKLGVLTQDQVQISMASGLALITCTQQAAQAQKKHSLRGDGVMTPVR